MFVCMYQQCVSLLSLFVHLSSVSRSLSMCHNCEWVSPSVCAKIACLCDQFVCLWHSFWCMCVCAKMVNCSLVCLWHSFWCMCVCLCQNGELLSVCGTVFGVCVCVCAKMVNCSLSVAQFLVYVCVSVPKW